MRTRLRVPSFAEAFTACGYGPVLSSLPLTIGQVVSVHDDHWGPFPATVQPGVRHDRDGWHALVHVHHTRPAKLPTVRLELPPGPRPGGRFGCSQQDLDDEQHPPEVLPRQIASGQVEILDEGNDLYLGVVETVWSDEHVEHYTGQVLPADTGSRHPSTGWTREFWDPDAVRAQDDLGMVCTCNPDGQQAAFRDRQRAARLLGRRGAPSSPSQSRPVSVFPRTMLASTRKHAARTSLGLSCRGRAGDVKSAPDLG